MKKKLLLILALITALFLVGCGGGSSDIPPPENGEPQSPKAPKIATICSIPNILGKDIATVQSELGTETSKENSKFGKTYYFSNDIEVLFMDGIAAKIYIWPTGGLDADYPYDDIISALGLSIQGSNYKEAPIGLTYYNIPGVYSVDIVKESINGDLINSINITYTEEIQNKYDSL